MQMIFALELESEQRSFTCIFTVDFFDQDEVCDTSFSNLTSSYSFLALLTSDALILGIYSVMLSTMPHLIKQGRSAE